MKAPCLSSISLTAVVLTWSAFVGNAMAAERPEGRKPKPLDIPSVGSESEYYQALGRIEQLDSAGQRASLVSPEFFQSLSWIGRTACVNYVCGILSLEQCRRVLERGMNDDALVVRDHALRIMITSSQFTENEKRYAADRSINDARNYRKGRPFWIVDRAKGYVNSETAQSSSGQ